MKLSHLMLLIPMSILYAEAPLAVSPVTAQTSEKEEIAPWSREAVIESVEAVEKAREQSALKLKASVAKVLQTRAAQMGDINASVEVQKDLVQIIKLCKNIQMYPWIWLMVHL